MHPVERDIRIWSRDFLEIPSVKLNGLPPCPYARKAWADDKVVFNNSLGDVTAIDIKTGELLWMIPTLSSLVIESKIFLKTSE